MTKTKILSASLLLTATLAAGCAGSNANTATGAATGAATEAAGAAGTSGTAAAAQTLGIKESLIQTALTAAQGYLSNSQAKTDADKDAAAKQGVDAAAAKAKEEGQELTAPQQTGLMDALKKML